jgi:hypothetical protein
MANTLEGYESVAERIEKFWIHYPMGRIDSKLLFQDGTRYVVQTDIYRDVKRHDSVRYRYSRRDQI